MKEKTNAIESEGEVVPSHMDLPDLQDILKMRPTVPEDQENDENIENAEEQEGDDDTTAFTFVVEHLVPAILGRKTWKQKMCSELVSTSFTPSDEAFLYVILQNSYDLWKSTNGSKMGTGTLTKDGTNKKFCGWTREGIAVYNEIMKRVKENRKGRRAEEVETAARKALQERYRSKTQTVAEKANSKRRKRRRGRRGDPFDSDDNDNEHAYGNVDADNDLSTVFALGV
jgi:hypothetical protein